MSGKTGDKVSFIPVEVVDPKEFKDSNSYKIIDNIKELSWNLPLHLSKTNKKHRLLSGIKSMNSKLETQTVYFIDLNSKISGFIQILYSNVMNGFYKGFQLNFKFFSCDKDVNQEFEIWESFKIDNVEFIKKHDDLYMGAVGNGISFKFHHGNDDHYMGTLRIKTNLRDRNIRFDLHVDLGDGFIINPNGSSIYLTKPVSIDNIDTIDKSVVKGYMRHLFVPKGKINGTIEYEKDKIKKTIELNEIPIAYLDAVQGLLPSKAAKRWNFMFFKSANYTILVIEYQTTPEYDNQKITMWSILHKDEIISIGSQVDNDEVVKFKQTQLDSTNGWRYPTAMSFNFRKSDTETYKLKLSKMNLVNRYDILGELPSIIRKLASGIANIKPFLYQYCQAARFMEEDGICIAESTFIS
ncbi:hypothetical protein KAFR_0E02600 [Kazachstania africana CBS 2517]|uniref:Svf1-like C-terminal domain-containing protein n=1 Tax=Kazachstania africana (strain ATCC 22294 / BCRC 22015 / CBS 2517 / CECT 1963 / NBRC 1671 / NRRL Y-8276) TaxID=1071382 RepID=H2AVL3_KAZAF|nr:hypothetical protein KAFR_0E02600 [Kazachstania africana CBS 2517]CCF58413.1 hypothetical protein KAFR_0E02600 [Kazachstania africana CBS 2517]